MERLQFYFDFLCISSCYEKIVVKIYAGTNLKIIDSEFLIGVVLPYRFL